MDLFQYKSFKDLYIQKIWIYPFPLIEKSYQRIHEGVLLKVLFDSNYIGYGSFHPLVYFGDQELKVHLESLKNKAFTHLMDLCLSTIYIDAQARSQKINLLKNILPIENHSFVSNIFSIQSFDSLDSLVIKIKMGLNLKEETKKLLSILDQSHKKIRLRIDFNHRLSQTQWKIWERNHAFLLPFIDFIEDPFWNFSKDSSFFPLAFDFGKSHFCPIRIVKPSRNSLQSLLKDFGLGQFQRVIFTHSLSHPLEARWAQVIANQFYKIHPLKKEICGLEYPNNFFEKNDFTCMENNTSSATGLGYDDILSQIKWQKWI